MFFLVETNSIAEHRRVILGDSPRPVFSFSCHITLDLVVSRHKPPLSTFHRRLQGLPDFGGKAPPPARARDFSRCSKCFEPLKRYLAVFLRTQKSVFGRIGSKLSVTADETSAAFLVAWAQNYCYYTHVIKKSPIPLAATCATCFLSVQWIVTVSLCVNIRSNASCKRISRYLPLCFDRML